MARKPITQRIALEGGDEFRAGLKSLGEEGQKAFGNLKQGADAIKSGTEAASESLSKIEGQAREFGKSLRSLGENAVQLGKNLAQVATAAVAVGTALFTLTKAGADAADKADEAAQAFGLTVKEYSRLRYALQFAAGGAEGTEKAFVSLNDIIVKTKEAGKGTETALTRLGINVRGATESGLRPTNEILADIADKFQAMPDSAEKSALAAELFGKRVGPRLIPLLNQGRKGLEALSAEADKLGVTFDSAQAKIGSDFNDAFDKLTSAAGGLRNQLGLLFAKDFTAIFQSITDIIANNRQAILDVASAVRTGLVTAFTAIKSVVVPILNTLYAAIQKITAAFNAVFGTNITAQQVIVVAAFTAIAGIVFTVAKAIATLIPGFTTLLSLLTGFPAIITTITSGFATLSAAFSVILNAVRLLVLVFGGVPLIIAAIVAAIVIFVATNKEARDAIVNAWTTAWTTVRDAALAAYTGITTAWNAVIEFFTAIRDGIVALFTTTWQTITDGITSVGTFFTQAWKTAVDAVTGYFKGWYDYVVGIFNKIIEYAKKVVEAVKAATSSGKSSGGGGGASGFARGGYVSGPGTSTSDSIYARLSDGEFVNRAKAVNYYGRDVFDALNRMQLPRNLFRGFNMGGLVGAVSNLMPVPGFADGGLVSVPAAGGGGGRPVILNMPGGGSFALNGSDDVVQQLERYANRSAVRATGRKPSWFKG